MGKVQRSERVKKRFAAAFAKSGAPLAMGETQDVSHQGIGLQGETSYPVGTELRIVIRPADQLPMELRGQVVWSTQRTMGVRLLGPQRRYLELVTTSVASEAERRSRPASNPTLPKLDPLVLAELAEKRAREATLPPEFRAGIRSRAPVALIPDAPPAPTPPEPPVQIVSRPLLKALPGMPSLPELPELTPVDRRLPGRPEARPPRFDEHLPLRMGTHPAKLDTRGFLMNLSRNGLSLQCTGTFPKGTRVAIAVTLPDEGIARIDGTVVWSHPMEQVGESEVGVRLLGTDGPFLQLVAQVRGRS